MLTRFAGPVFGPEDSVGLLLMILVTSLPFIFMALSLALVIRDAIQKRFRRSTKIVIGITVLIVIIMMFMSRVW